MWAQILNTLYGILLMVLPWILDMNKEASDNFHIFGPLIGMFGCIAIFECTRNVRYFNIPLGAWVVISPIFIHHNTTLAAISAVVIGGLVVAFSLIKGKIESQFGGGWRALIK